MLKGVLVVVEDGVVLVEEDGVLVVEEECHLDHVVLSHLDDDVFGKYFLSLVFLPGGNNTSYHELEKVKLG
jgi:hypothetical protein